jgi:uncharacterized membrane protein YgdD (TMEM256/DUF423 family)
MTRGNPWLVVAAISGGVATFAGAYGWHWLEADDGGREMFNMGVQYHMWHSLALLAVAWFTEQRRNTNAAKWGNLAGGLFLAGIVLFSGTLYTLGISGELLLSGAAPAGGVALMAGWAVLAFAATRKA